MTVVVAGPLDGLARILPRVDTEALEQDILVRKVERDVEELERLGDGRDDVTFVVVRVA